MIDYVCVYCGSAIGRNPSYAKAAAEVGSALARHGLGLVYGGGCVGLMGITADAVLAGGGRVIGIIPQALASKEIEHDGLTELHVVADMHERKALMAQRSSAFLTLPGGVGTYEEFFETLSWAALHFHDKPMGILNVAGYFDPLLTLLDHGVSEGFIKPDHLRLVTISDDPERLVDDLVRRRRPARADRQAIDFDGSAEV
jgi:uncharacterized protein (TIGR00730 family)